ncbi:MAG: M56 family metallopeptidase [Terracidiphilus sp.]|jgi:beta-lactamase regulating signal transducer with metallopeptidase domain
MDPLLHTISIASALAAGSLFSAIWEGAVLAICVAVCLRLLPSLNAAARSVIWTNVFLLLALMHVLPYIGEHLTMSKGYRSSPYLLDPRWGLAIAYAWAMLSLWKAVQLILSASRCREIAVRAVPIQTDAALLALLQVRRVSGPGRMAELCASSEIERPSVFGFFHPRILLPSGLVEQLSASDLRQVVMHEMEHLRRGDDWTNLLQKVGLVLFPLNPALLWVERRLCAERELACDDGVLHSTDARKAYAICLTRLAEYSMLRRKLSLALGAWERRSELVRRIHRILQSPDHAMSRKRAVVVTCGLMIAVSTGAVALARSPQLLSFAPHAQMTMQAHFNPNSGLQEINAREFSGSPELVKADMSQTRSKTTYDLEHRRLATGKRNVRSPQAFPNQTAWIVLTEWRDSEPPPHVIIAVSQDQRISYAVVSVANGWLIVQI